jgi:Na+-transporting methylmalonyl-CoA/oxaloacetate decarboxylase gamma subunit
MDIANTILLLRFCLCFFFKDCTHHIFVHTISTMKSFQQVLLLLIAAVACVSGFVPVTSPRSTTSLAMSNKAPEPVNMLKDEKKAAAVAAFATAMAPFAAHADTVDEATVIGYGAGLVACVVSLAVGFAIGYGTLAKL